MVRDGLLFHLSEIDRIRENAQTGIGKEMKKRMLYFAELFMGYPSNPYKFGASNAVEYEKAEFQLSIAGRTLQQHMLTLAMAGMLEQNKAYTQKAVEMLISAAEQAELEFVWQMNSALSMGDMTHAFCMGYEWLYDFLTEKQRSLVEQRIEEFGAWLYEHSFTDFWGENEPGRYAHNWNTVTHGNLGLCGLLTGNQKWIDRAKERIRLYFSYSKDETGMSYEGVSYMCYGLNGAVAFAIALERLRGENLFAGHENMKKIAQGLFWSQLPGRQELVIFNQSSKLPDPAWSIFYFINRYKDQFGLWEFIRLLGGEKGTWGQGIWAGACASIAYSLIFYDPSLTPKAPEEKQLEKSFCFERGTLVIRDDFSDESNLVTFDCGKSRENIWNHCDTGNITYFAAGTEFLTDPGAGYGGSAYHNIVFIDGKGLGEKGGPQNYPGKMVSYQDNGEYVAAEGDMTEAYAVENPVETASRKLQYIRGKVPVLIVSDRIRKDGAERTYTEHFITSTANTVEAGKNCVTITSGINGSRCNILFFAAEDITFTIEEKEFTTVMADIRTRELDCSFVIYTEKTAGDCEDAVLRQIIADTGAKYRKEVSV